SAACLTRSFTRSAPFTVCETSATAAAASSLILSASTIVTRGIKTFTGSPSSPFSVRVTSSLRQLTTLRMSDKAEELELADDLLDRHLGALSPGAHDLRDAGANLTLPTRRAAAALATLSPWPLALLFDEDFVAAPADFGWRGDGQQDAARAQPDRP